MDQPQRGRVSHREQRARGEPVGQTQEPTENELRQTQSVDSAVLQEEHHDQDHEIAEVGL